MHENLDQSHHNVLLWAKSLNLIEGSDPKSQCLKFMEEVGELSKSINKQTDVRDDIGDCLVVLTILAAQKGTSLQECLAMAYADIKDRKGVMLDGVFVKSTDEHYAHACAVLGARRVHTDKSDLATELMSKE